MAMRDTILQDVEVLSNSGTAGRMVVFGSQAEPILTGSTEIDVLLAAAEYGNGRIVAIAGGSFSDNLYYDESKNVDQSMIAFVNNVKSWVTKGTFESDDDIVDACKTGSEDLLDYSKLVVWFGGEGSMPEDKLREFVRNGGGFLYCFNPWGWAQNNCGKSLSDAPYMSLLAEAGMSFTGEYIQVSSDGFGVAENKAADAHLQRYLDAVRQDFALATTKYDMMTRLSYVPADTGVIDKSKELLSGLLGFFGEEINKNIIPSSGNPVSGQEKVTVLDLWTLCTGLLDVPLMKAPGVEEFPGDCPVLPMGSLSWKDLEISSDREDFYSTFCYLPPGQILAVEVISGNENKDWQVMVGAHTDELKGNNLQRWPIISKKVKLTDGLQKISSPFGGSVYLISPDAPGSSIKVQLRNFVTCPHYKLLDGDEGKAEWTTSRKSPAPWADIVGENVTITLQSSNVAQLDADVLSKAMKIWDSVVVQYHDLRGTDISQYRRQWIVTDIQPAVGYMHNGYPVVTHLDVGDPTNSGFLFNVDTLQKEGNWGVFHEIGHNFQRDAWTFDGTREVTANIFTLWAMKSICNVDPWIHPWLQRNLTDAVAYLKGGVDFGKWKSKAAVALFFYAQLIHEFGFESYKKVFRLYEDIPDDQKARFPHEQYRIDTWFSIFSQVVGYNLYPMAKFWGIGVSQDMASQLETTYPSAFLPDDEITQSVPDQVDALLQQFPSIVRNATSA